MFQIACLKSACAVNLSLGLLLLRSLCCAGVLCTGPVCIWHVNCLCLLFTTLTQTVAGEEQTEARLERLRAESVVLEAHTRALESGQLPHTHAEGRVEEQTQEALHTHTTESEEESQGDATIEVRHMTYSLMFTCS